MFVRKVSTVVVLALAFALVASLPVCAAPKVSAPVGVVVLGQGAQVSHVDAENGTSLYPGDTLSTDNKGSLRVRFGSSQLMLGPATVVTVAQGQHGVTATLQHGTMRFSAASTPIELHALAAIVNPQQDDASGELVIVNQSEFQIASSKGNLDVDIDGDSRTVAENTAYDVTLEPVPADPQTVGGGRVKGLWILIALILLITAGGLYAATLSCSKF